MFYTRFYDQVLAELEAGNATAGITLLAGMLDTVGLQPGALECAKAELDAHELGAMLCEDPLFAPARAQTVSDAGRLARVATNCPGETVSSTGLRLFAASCELTIVRALRQRHLCLGQRLERAWQTGQRICVVSTASETAFAWIEGRDHSTIQYVARDDVPQFLQERTETTPGYDLILAPDVADGANEATLGRLLCQLRACLNPNGSIALAAINPDHLGSGWCSAYLGWEPDCHDDATLARLAAAAGLAARTYHDETGCIVWSEMKLVRGAHHKGEDQ